MADPGENSTVTRNERFDALMRNSPMLVAFLDAEFRILSIFTGSGVFSAGIPDGVVGQPLANIAPRLWAHAQQWLEQVRDKGEPVSGVEFGAVALDTHFERFRRGACFPVGDGPPFAVGCVLEDITELAQARQAWDYLARISEITAVPNFDVAVGLQEIVDTLVPGLADTASIALADRPEIAFGHVNPELRTRLQRVGRRITPVGVELALAERLKGRPRLIDPVTDDMVRGFIDDPEQLELQIEGRAHSLLMIPLVVEGRILGLMTLAYTRDSERRYSPENIDLAQQIGIRVAMYLERVRLSEEMSRARARVDVLARLGEMVDVELDVKSRLYTLPRVLIPALADVCAVYRVDGDSIAMLHSTAMDPTIQRLSNTYGPWPGRPIGENTPAARAARTRQPVFVEHVDSQLVAELARTPQELAMLQRAGIKSLLCIPLISESSVVGVLAFGSTSSDRTYSPEDISTAVEVGRRVSGWMAQAIRFERQRATTEHLQRALLPEQLPRLGTLDVAVRYVPGAIDVQVGGDWYDAMVLSDGRVMLAIGDVVGHGAGAAATMARLRTVIEMQAISGSDPAQILEQCNAFAHSRREGEMATILVIVVDPVSGRCEYARGGHLPPIVRRNGGTSSIEGPSGPPIGALVDGRYEVDHFTIGRNEMVLLCTDGLVERRSAVIDDRLNEVARVFGTTRGDAEGIADAVLDAMTADQVPVDDVALVVVRRPAATEAFDIRVEADFAELQRVRGTVVEWANALGLDADSVHDITLTVNELVANGIEHGGTAVYVGGRVTDAMVRIEVRDGGVWRARRRPEPGPESVRGRGTVLADRLSSHRSVHAGPRGTTVIVEFPLVFAEPDSSGD